MGDLPWGHVLLILLLDVLVIELLSLFIARVVSTDATRPVLVYGLAVMVPVIGPLVWGAWWLPRRPMYAGRPRASRIALGLFALSALLFAAATFCAWLKASGDVHEDWALSLNASPADSLAGAVTTLGTTVVVAALIAGLWWLPWSGRIAAAGAAVGAAWLVVTLDTLVAVSAVDDLTSTGSNLAGGTVTAEVRPGLGLWLCITASVVIVAAGILTSMTAPAHAGAAFGPSPAIAGAPLPSSHVDSTGDVW